MLAYRIIVMGSFGAGKTFFIRQISEIEVVSTYRVNDPEMLALNFGRINGANNTVLYLFGVPNNRRFDPGTKMYNLIMTPPEICGAVVMVNTADPDSIKNTSTYLHMLRSVPYPYVVVANQRQPQQVTPLPIVRKQLCLRDDEILLPFYGERMDTSMVLLELLGRMSQNAHTQELVARIEQLNQLAR